MINVDKFTYSRLNVSLPLEKLGRVLSASELKTYNCSIGSHDFELLNKHGELAPAGAYEQIDLIHRDLENHRLVYTKSRDYSVWDVFNFTVPTHVDVPFYDNYPSGRFDIRDNHDKEHAWIQHPLVPTLQKISAQLFYKKVIMCRMMALARGKFAPFHTDTTDSVFRSWWKLGLVRTNVVLTPQASDFAIKIGTKIYRFNDSVFTFNDALPHGVFQTTVPRISLVFFGEVDLQAYESLLTLD